MIVLSVFGGIESGMIALKRAKVPVEKYYSSEIDKFPMKVAKKNYPEIIQLGDIENWIHWNINWSEINLVIAGSPCQGFSFAGKQLNFDDDRSKLFFVFVDILNHIKMLNPDVKFLLENVNMKQEYLRVISEYLGIFPVRINSNLVSAQNRDRVYWSNIKIEKRGLFSELYTGIPQPLDKKIYLKDILQPENEIDEKYYIKNPKIGFVGADINGKNKTLRSSGQKTQSEKHNFDIIKLDRNLNKKADQKKAACLTVAGHSGANHSDMDILYIPEGTKKGYIEIKPGECFDNQYADSKTRKGRKMDKKSNCLVAQSTDFIRYTEQFRLRRLTPIECERLQTVPDNYTACVSDSQRYKMLGNGWTIDIIAHFFSYLNKTDGYRL